VTPKYKVGDLVVATDGDYCVVEIVEIGTHEYGYKFVDASFAYYEMEKTEIHYLDFYHTEKSSVPKEIYDSPLYQAMREEE
jgi:hypothetical protein